jgi:hypothetical protein
LREQKPAWRAELAAAEKIRDEVWRDHALEMVQKRDAEKLGRSDDLP